jgi:Ca2+-binding RTX toxin-like protein
MADQFISGAVPRTTTISTVPQADFRDATSGAAGNWTFNHPIPGGGGDHYVLRASGTLQVSTAGSFTFALGTDNGGRLRIDGADVIVDNANHGFTTLFGTVTLVAGAHTFELVGYEGGGAAGFEVSVAVGSGIAGPVSEANGWRVLGAANPHSQIALSGGISTTAYYPNPGPLNVSIAGNYIGTNPAGTAAMPNAGSGIAVTARSQGVRIGTNGDGVNDPVERNVIAGNNNHGVVVLAAGTQDNVIAGNYVGTDHSGTAAVPNLWSGIAIAAGATINRVGTNSDGLADTNERNVVSGNALVGVWLTDIGTEGNVVAGNYVGLTASGLSTVSNGWEGIALGGGAKSNRIGTNGDGVNDSAERNIVSGNLLGGITIGRVFSGPGTENNIVAGNFVGTDPTGLVALGNITDGVAIYSAANNVIGGAVDAARNIIAASTGHGVLITGTGATGNLVAGNYIGTGPSGTIAMGNAGDGVRIAAGAAGNTIGGDDDDDGTLDGVVRARNVVSGNTGDGVEITGAGTSNNTLAGNFIGTNASGTAALGNGSVYSDAGVAIFAGAANNTIGGTEPGAGNLISGNVGAGIHVNGGTTTGTVIRGNYIGTDVTGAAAVGNGYVGIWLEAPDVTIGGGMPGARNLISGNINVGVYGPSVNGRIQGNYIGTTAAGNALLANGGQGAVQVGGDGLVVGVDGDGVNDAGEGNVIVGPGDGITLGNYTVSSIVVAGNIVGLNAAGTAYLGAGPVRVFYQFVNTTVRFGTNTDGVSDTLERNLFASGLSLDTGINHVVAGNYFNTDSTGLIDLGDGYVSISSNGARFGTNADGLRDDVERNVVVGSGSGNMFIYGNSNTIAGNYIGLGSDGMTAIGAQGGPPYGGGIYVFGIWGGVNNTIGGSSPAARNIISGHASGAGVTIRYDGATGNVVQGNWIGLDATGTLLRGNAVGVAIEHGAENNVVSGNVISGNAVAGVRFVSGPAGTNIANVILSGNPVTGNVVTGNLIGTNPAGTAAMPNAVGVLIDSNSTNNTIGGSTPGAGNVVSGNSSNGIQIVGGNVTGNVVRGNFVGLASDGLGALSNSGAGIYVSGAPGTIIGGAAAGEGNTIGYNLGAGLRLVDATAAGNPTLRNVFRGNLGGAIDLGPAPGVTLNDAGDANGFLNFPVITLADIVGGNLVVGGFARGGVAIDFFLSSPGMGSLLGYGQGRQFIASRTEGSPADLDATTGSYGPTVDGVQVGSDTTNRFRFEIPLATLPSEVQIGALITSVALGSTSEFGNARPLGLVVGNGPPLVLAGDNAVIAQGTTFERSGYFIDPDSTSWVATVNYGDGSGVQPLSFTPSEHSEENPDPDQYPDGATHYDFRLRRDYALPGLYTVTVSVVDNGQLVGVDSFDVNVLNAAPEATFNVFAITNPVVEGQLVTLTGRFTDPGLADTHTVQVDWGDGLPRTIAVVDPVARTFTATKTYRDDNPSSSAVDQYRVQVFVVDNYGAAASTPLGLFLEEVRNVLPGNLSFAVAPAADNENELVTLTGTFTDPGFLDAHDVTIDWGDGSPPARVALPASGILVSSIPPTEHRYLDDPRTTPSTYTITVSVTDDDEPLAAVSQTLTASVGDVAPHSVLVTTPAAVDEFGVAAINVSFVDPGSLDVHRVIVDWGDASPAEEFFPTRGLRSLTNLLHRYRNDALGTNSYTITVRVADNNQPLAFGTGTATLLVTNLAPIASPLALDGPAVISEGDLVTISGSYTDDGSDDRHTVSVNWGDGSTSPALVNSAAGMYVASHRYRDDNPSGTPADTVSIVVTIDDQDGGVTTATTSLTVNNVAPRVQILPGDGSTEEEVHLISLLTDPGVGDTFTYAWTLTSSGTPPTIMGGTAGPNLSFLRNGDLDATYIVTLTVTDDDTGVGAMTTSLALGTPANDTLAYTRDSFPTGVTNLLVLGLAGSDVLDARAVPAGLNVILDGGPDTDYLFGGGGDDTFLLRQGDDQANIAVPTVVDGGGDGELTTPILPIDVNTLGRDRYYFFPNSTLSVFDDSLDANALDFTFSTRAVQFDLSLASGELQDVDLGSQPQEHFVSAEGVFPELVGSGFGDILTGASYSTVYGDDGADLFYVHASTVDATLFGGADADQLVIRPADGGLSDISFSGDDGADVFDNSGTVTDVDFSGGSGGDSLFNRLLGTIADLVFTGDDGADIFVNDGQSSGEIVVFGGSGADQVDNGGTLSEIVFTGDDGADVFDNSGDVTGTITFEGGTDADKLLISETGRIFDIVFHGDDGADTFENDGEVQGTVVFDGGEGGDQASNDAPGQLSDIVFSGDDGADIFTNDGEVVGTITFAGGSGSDLLINTAPGMIGDIVFQGDDGADVFTTSGQVSGTVIFTGGAENDSITVEVSATAGEIVFSGDDGADVFENSGSVGQVTFDGGLGNDAVVNRPLALVAGIVLTGDDGADIFTNAGTVAGTLDFVGEAGSDLIANQPSGRLTDVVFHGDDGADVFANAGQVSGTVIFEGGSGDDGIRNVILGQIADIMFSGDDGADVFESGGTVGEIDFDGASGDDTIVIQPSGSVDVIVFTGDDGADVFQNEGDVLGTITFGGGSGDDRILTTPESSVGAIVFTGDLGADVLFNQGEATSLSFTGGAGGDWLWNEASGLARIEFIGFGAPVGDDGADIFVNTGDDVGQIDFEGGSGGDVIQNTGSDLGQIVFTGDDGADILINSGDGVGQIDFTGGAASDTLTNSGGVLDVIVFTGDAGVDIFVNRGPAEGPDAYLEFFGGSDDDAFRNDGTGFGSVVFYGADGNDVFQNNADGLPFVHFTGDAGTDVLENNAASVTWIEFVGGADGDVLINDGINVGQLDFAAGAGADALLNTGTGLVALRFLGGDGNDALELTSSGLAGNYTFDGEGGDDYFQSSAANSRGLHFLGGLGNDLAWLTPAASATGGFEFEGGDGDDRWRNEAAGVASAVLAGGAGNDTFENVGANLIAAQVGGGDGDDAFFNAASGITAFQFAGGAGSDTFYNRGGGFAGVVLGEDGPDVFINDGQGATFEFFGGEGMDAATNNALAVVEIRMTGGDDDDRLLNTGAAAALVEFYGDAGNDAIRNLAALVAMFQVFGGEGDDSFDQRGDELGVLYFEGQAGADALLLSGAGLVSATFLGGEGSDTLRVDGKNLLSVQFDGAGGPDSLVISRGAGSGSQFTFAGAEGDDVFIGLGDAASYAFAGGSGADRALVRGPGTFQLAGQDGDDAYLFSGEFSPLSPALVMIDEVFTPPLDESRDLLDFSALQASAVNLDLASTNSQPQAGGGLVLTLSDGSGIEDVVGTAGADVIYGNDRDNRLSGAEYAPAYAGPAAASDAAVQWVLLDFDTETQAGEHVYTAAERGQIAQRLLAYYQGPDPLAPWFRVAVTQSAGDIPAGLDYVTMFFNKTPGFDRPGGEASALDFRNLDLGGSAAIQVNGLLGSGDQPVATSENFVGLAAKVAAHELGHLLGLRHQDAFGPIGFGLSPTPRSNMKPGFAGPLAGFETFDHVSSSPSSVGSDRFNDLRGLHFGERETIKLAVGQALQADVAVEEMSGDHNQWTTAQSVPLVRLPTPNAAAQGIYAGKRLLVDTRVVTGAIGLTLGHSESDFYSFMGRAGQWINLEVLSQSLTRLGGLPATTIDPVIRVYKADGSLLQLAGGEAVNDDQLEGTDASLFDILLPEDGIYIIEVDTFRHDVTGPLPDLSGLPEPVRDAFLDTDVGQYELFIYTFETANASDGPDTLVGGLGQDQLDGGPGDSYSLALELGPPIEVVAEDLFVRSDIPFVDRGGNSWTATVDYGDGGGVMPLEIELPGQTIDLAHTYMVPGPYQIAVTITSDDGQTVTDTLNVTALIPNQPPVVVFDGPGTSVRGQDRGFVFRAIDPNPVDQTGPFTYRIQWGDGSPEQVVPAGDKAIVPHVYTTLGTYAVAVSVEDPRGLVSPQVGGSITALRFEIQPDPLLAGATMLVMGGSLGDDTLKVTPADQPEFLKITINELEQDVRIRSSVDAGVRRVAMYGQAGSDRLQVDSLLALEAWLYGGDGDDRLIGSLESDMLQGGAGADRLDGFDGRDLLIGGSGGDLLHGGEHDDILVAGWTIHDSREGALDAILAEWRSARTYDQRVQNLRQGGSGPRNNGDTFLNDTTARDEAVHDRLFGEGGLDWYLLNLDGDGGSDLDLIDLMEPGEAADDLDQ